MVNFTCRVLNILFYYFKLVYIKKYIKIKLTPEIVMYRVISLESTRLY